MRCRSPLAAMGLGFVLAMAQFAFAGGVPEIDEPFDDDPLENGFVLNGAAFWVPPDAPACESSFVESAAPCNFYEGEDEGYIVLTPIIDTQVGNIFTADPIPVDSVVIQAIVELRDAELINSPADGVGITLIGGDSAPAVPGEAGGGMGIGQLGGAPQLSLELDTWNNAAAGADPSGNHATLHWSPDGLPGFGSFPATAVATFDIPAENPLHNRQAFPDVASNRIEVTMAIQGGVVSVHLNFIDTGANFGEIINYTIPDFEPFDGFLGVSAATGGENTNHILHHLVVTADVPCLEGPGTVVRNVAQNHAPDEFCGGTYAPGEDVAVTLTVASLRGDEAPCSAVTKLNVAEVIPDQWTLKPETVTNGGIFTPADRTIRWSLTAGVAGTVLGYTVTAADTATAAFTGEIVDPDGTGTSARSGIPATEVFRGGAPETCAVDEFEDTFEDDPLDNGWIFNGVAAWVPPDSRYCEDFEGNPTPNDFDPLDPCTVYTEDEIDAIGAEEFGGYVLITPGQLTQAGNIFRDEPALYDNFQLDIEIEIRDGTLGQPADGMCVVLLGSPEPPGLGTGGGAMGATDLGPYPHMLFEFDNWNCNGADRGDDNHVGFAFRATGITGDPPNDVFVPFASPRLHPRQPAPADPNRFRMSVRVQGSTVACDLIALDEGTDLGTLYVHEIPNFRPFNGFLGVTASTGNASQNHIFHSAKLTKLPPSCTIPASTMARSFSGLIENPDPETSSGGQFNSGDVIGVQLEITDLREAEPARDCEVPTRLFVSDQPPAGFAVSNISHGGQLAGGVVTWDLQGGDVAVGTRLTYDVTAPAITQRTYTFLGRSGDAGDDGQPKFGAILKPHEGVSSLTAETAFGLCGGIITWNILGPYAQPDGQVFDNPGDDNMRQDYLTDGTVSETEFEFRPGAEIETDFGGAAWSVGLRNNANGHNPGGIPTVVAWNDPDTFINLNDDVYGADPNQCMAYAQIYVTNTTDEDIEVDHVGADSDDSIQVLVDGVEVHINSVARGGVDACASRDDGTVPFTLVAGQTHSVIVKTFEGGGGFNFALRFENVFFQPITQGLVFSKCPGGDCGGAPKGTEFIRGNADGQGGINITDGVFVLNFLFQGGGDPPCKDAADADNSNGINITDGVFILNFLFQGGPDPAAPYPDCGVDPDQDATVDCVTANPACL